jgi:hypothetical protein
MYGWEALYFNAKDGYLEGILRGHKKGLLTVRPPFPVHPSTLRMCMPPTVPCEPGRSMPLRSRSQRSLQTGAAG